MCRCDGFGLLVCSRMASELQRRSEVGCAPDQQTMSNGAGLAISSHLSLCHLHTHAVAVQQCMQRSFCLPSHNCSSRDATTRSFSELPSSPGLHTASLLHTCVSTAYHTPRLAMEQVQAASIRLALPHLPALSKQYVPLPNGAFH